MPHTNEDDLDDKLKAIRQMLDMFKFERMIYLSITILSLLILVGCAVYLLLQKQVAAVIGMFASTGGIAYTCGRLLKMWGDAMQFLGTIKNEKDGE